MRPKTRLLGKRIPNEPRAIKKSLELWSDRLSGWADFFTAVVVGGLIVEYLPEITYFLPVSFVPEIRAHAEQLRELGGLLVIIGVAGEFGIGRRSSKVETDLREETNSIISAADERISETLDRAASAERQTAELELEIAASRERLAARV
jgi:hypothetical protein